MLGESDENFEGWQSFPPTNNTPDILTAGQNFNPIFLSPTETFPQNFLLQPTIRSKFLNPELQKLVF